MNVLYVQGIDIPSTSERIWCIHKYYIQVPVDHMY